MPEDPKKRFWERDTWSDSGAECALKEAIAAAWATAFAKTGDKNLADDGSQEAALEVLAKKSPSDFNGAIHLVRYMCRCAFCRAISQLRKDQRCCRYGDAVDQIVDDRLDHTLLAEWREAGERARAAIAALPPDRRCILEAKLRGRTGKKIAADVGLSEATVSRRLAKILDQLRDDTDRQGWDFGVLAAAVSDFEHGDGGRE